MDNTSITKEQIEATFRLAVIAGYRDIMEILIKSEAHANETLKIASIAGNYAVAQFAIDKGATNIDACLRLALFANVTHPDIANLLIERGARLREQ